MIFEQISVGSMQNFCYLFGDEESKEGFIIDPAFEPRAILRAVKSLKLNISRIILSHHHFDHVNEADSVKARTGARIFAHHAAENFLRGSASLDGKLSDGETFDCGASSKVHVIHAPGHAPDGVCLVVDGTWLITGDTLFIGDCGRTDLPGSSPRELFDTLQRIKQLPDSLIVCPGHDYGPVKWRTLGDEKRLNPALRATSFGEFQAIP